MSEKNSEYDNFDRTMRDLMNVSHDEIKAELETEKSAKGKKQKAKRKPSASVHDDEGKTD